LHTETHGRIPKSSTDERMNPSLESARPIRYQKVFAGRQQSSASSWHAGKKTTASDSGCDCSPRHHQWIQRGNINFNLGSKSCRALSLLTCRASLIVVFFVVEICAADGAEILVNLTPHLSQQEARGTESGVGAATATPPYRGRRLDWVGSNSNEWNAHWQCCHCWIRLDDRSSFIPTALNTLSYRLPSTPPFELCLTVVVGKSLQVRIPCWLILCNHLSTVQ
jgi:hypothetical protein